ncbi:hypothetical protein EYF80_062558 [Liparis tanakae]|uniref:Uncharacterized protein n=1 Tax=Liparis tanakae TaxID=230148 RepID=A0A4Z2EEY6_9TELE|nr:hypothetical protein EYF80_062558 [Liparis tanakae]
MDAVDSSLSVTDDVAAPTVCEDSAHGGLDPVDDANRAKGSRDEDARDDDAESADAVSRGMEIDDITVRGAKDNGAGCESDGDGDGDGDNEGCCLEAMTSDGQDYYLRLGHTPRRRSALRLSRIIARQQLLRRLAQGRAGGSQITAPRFDV